jgi:hypothetical protein
MLCFPARMLLWTVPAAALATWISKKFTLPLQAE